MVKGRLKLFREVASNIRHVATIDYPVGEWPGTRYRQIPVDLRGKLRFDAEKCIGCGACSQVCSSGANTFQDRNGQRVISVSLGRCIFCGRCRDLCPQEAVGFTPEFELSYLTQASGEATQMGVTLDLSRCMGCGVAFAPLRQIEAVSERVLANIDASVRERIAVDQAKYTRYCPSCRRKMSYNWDTHPRRYY